MATIYNDSNESSGLSDKNWLDRLKNESWQAELIVSTVAIFGTFELFKGIDWVVNLFIDYLPAEQHKVAYFISLFGLLAISILATMFVIHFILRAYWIGLVGLNSVFPDYSLEDSPYSEIYTEKITSFLPKIEDSITKVDDLCSVIFSTAFTFLFIYLYSAVIAGLYLLLYNLLLPYVSHEVLMIPAYILAFIIVVQMLLAMVANIKKYKNHYTIQNWYYISVKVSYMVMVGPLYKSILQVMMIFGSNYKKRKSMVYMMLLFIFVGGSLALVKFANSNMLYFLVPHIYQDEDKAYNSYYLNQNEDVDFLLTPEIGSDKIMDGTVRLFIPIFGHESKLRDKICPDINIDENLNKDEIRRLKKDAKLKCYNSYNHVYLNDKEVDVSFMRYNHPITDQFGIITYVDASELPRGVQNIKISKEYGTDERTTWSIPFYNIPID